MWPEVLPAFGIIVGCITATGLALKYLDRYEHSGKVSVYMCCVEWWALIGTLLHSSMYSQGDTEWMNGTFV